MNKCDYCFSPHKGFIHGKSIKNYDWKETSGFNSMPIMFEARVYHNWFLEMLILKGNLDEKAGLMIDTGNGYRYVDIDYCPFCGRKLTIGDDENDS